MRNKYEASYTFIIARGVRGLGVCPIIEAVVLRVAVSQLTAVWYLNREKQKLILRTIDHRPLISLFINLIFVDTS